MAKIRIAVASPLQLKVFLLESYVLSWSNHNCLDWDGSALKEDPFEEFARNYKQYFFMQLDRFVLPYDFENFDHQLRQAEILIILKYCHLAAKLNYTGDQPQEFAKALNIIRESVKIAYVADPPSHGHKKYPVQNGRISGMRATSIIGNAFNLISYKMALTILKLLYPQKDFDLNIEIRGDDLRVSSKNQ